MTVIFQKTNKDYSLKASFFPEDSQTLFLQIKSFLNEKELTYFRSLKNEKRKKEWCGTRILLKEIYGEYLSVNYDKNGKPNIKKKSFVSITHSGDYIAVIISNKEETGIDIEIINERIIRTAHKFIPAKESDILKKNNDIDKIYLHWCAKETLFKIKGGGGYDFIKDFNVEVKEIKNKGNIKSSISKFPYQTFILQYHIINHNNNKIILVWHS